MAKYAIHQDKNIRTTYQKFCALSVTRDFRTTSLLAKRGAGFLNFVTATDEVSLWCDEASPEKG